MVLKGFLLLHRDASTGRFAAQRAGGFGSYHRHAEIIDKREMSSNNNLVEVLPPTKNNNSLMNRVFYKLAGGGGVQKTLNVPYDSIAPPSDYFLGFSSPGTQVRTHQ